jgi:hypothetical protein
MLLHVFAAMWVGEPSEISSNPPGEMGGFRFHPTFTRIETRGWPTFRFHRFELNSQGEKYEHCDSNRDR